MKAYTTGEIARICGVSTNSVVKWFDSGKLRGYRIPGSQARRVQHETLVRFMKENGLPLGELAEEQESKDDELSEPK